MSHRRRRWLLLGGFVLLVVVGLIAAKLVSTHSARAQRELPALNGANVVLVTLDTTRADRLGCYGYSGAETPYLDGLARDGVLFEHAVTPTAFTLPSHSSILTGYYPPYHGVRLNGHAALADVQVTLAEKLASAGYRTGAFVAAFVLDGRWGLEQGFEHYDDDFKLKTGQKLDLAGVQRTANQVVDATLGWLEQPDDRPFLAWLHLYDPHTPYDPPEPFKSRFGVSGPTGLEPGRLDDADDQASQMRAWRDQQSSLYDGEIAFADSQVGRVLDWLEVQGLADNTIVVVVGDHGEAIGSHGEIEHGYYVYDYAVKVPFLLKLPKGALAGLRVGSQVRTVDVLPTILQLVGVEGIHGIHGESVVPLMLEPGREPPRYAYCESMAPNLQYGWSALYSVRTEEHKYISAPREELYSLLTDVGETSNVVAEHSELAQEMKMILEEIRQRIAEGAPQAEEANIDDQTLALLASLGYVGGSSGPYEGENLADPKDKLHLYQAIGLAAQLISDDDYAGAATQLQMVLQEDEEIPQARLLLATSYRKTGRSQEAKAILDNYLREDPESVQALITMAGLLSEEGKTQEVLAICQRALAVDDRNTQAYALMADVYMKSDDHERALAFLRTAVEIQPKLSRIRNNLAACLVGLEEFEEAEILLSGIVTSYPKFPLANFHLGLMHEEQKQFPQARSAYSREIELNPDSIRARFNLGNLLFGLGDMPGGEEQMRELMTRAPDMARPYLLLARAQLARSGDPREIEDLARKGLDRAEAPELKALGYFLLADAFSRQGRQSEIPEVVEKARFYQAQIGSETTH